MLTSRLLICSLLILSGCNLGTSNDTIPPTRTPSIVSTLFPTDTPSEPIFINPNLPTIAITNAPTITCVPRSDWVIYTVQEGDTLGSIGERIGMTINELSFGNCMSNADMIFVGQAIRVPRLPNANFGGVININPVLRVDSGWTVVDADTPLTLEWNGYPADTIQVQFFAAPSGTEMTPEFIGADVTLADGATVVWQVPAGFMGHLSASAVSSSGAVVGTSDLLNVYAE